MGGNDIRTTGIEAAAWANASQYPERQSEQIPTSSIIVRECLIMDKKVDSRARLFARPSVEAVSQGIWRGAHHSTTPPTISFTNECLIGFATKIKTRRMSEGGGAVGI